MTLFAVVFLLTACSPVEKKDDFNQTNESFPPAETKVQEGDFTYRLLSEKDNYDKFGDTAIFAELTYVGEMDSIDIYHSASPFYFPLEERTRGFEVDYLMNEPLIVTRLVKGEPFRQKYNIAGGFSDIDDAKYVEFIKTLMNEGFPEGEYIIHGSADFYIVNPAGATDKETYNINADIGFTVTKGVNE